MNKKDFFVQDPPQYFYRVSQLVSFRNETFPIHSGSYYRDFSGDDLLECRSKAYQFCLDMMSELENGSHFMLDEGHSIHVLGKDGTICMVISLIEYFNDEDYNSYALNSDNIQVRKQCMEMEKRVLASLCMNSTAA